MRELGPGDHAVMVVSAGPLNPLGEDFVLGSIPDRLSVQQGGLTINARDMAIERRGAGMEDLPEGPWTILKVASRAGFYPSAPWMLTERIVRERGQILVERVSRDLSTTYALPPALFCASSTGSRAGPSAAAPASSAGCGAATVPSRPWAGSTTPSASSAWIA